MSISLRLLDIAVVPAGSPAVASTGVVVDVVSAPCTPATTTAATQAAEISAAAPKPLGSRENRADLRGGRNLPDRVQHLWPEGAREAVVARNRLLQPVAVPVDS